MKLSVRVSVATSDTNGDGLVDQGYLVNAEGDVTGTHTEELAGCYRQRFGFGNKRCFTGDFNQDGKTDFFRVTNDNSHTLQIKMNGENNWMNTVIQLPTITDLIVSLSDYNGDGWPDFVVRQSETTIIPSAQGFEVPKVFLYLHTHNASAPYNENNRIHLLTLEPRDNDTDFYQDIQEQGDMDGNGMPDFIIFRKPNFTAVKQGMAHPTKLMLSQSQIGGGLTFDEFMFNGFIDVANSDMVDAHFFHDVNGDGLADWLSVDKAYNLNVKINQGGRFSSESLEWIDLQVRIPTRQHFYYPAGAREGYVLPLVEKTLVMDYNGDGKSELLIAKTEVVASACSLVEHFGLFSTVEDALMPFDETISAPLMSDFLCDEALWGLYKKNSNTNQYSLIDGSRKDVSARRYKAIYFEEDLNGNVSARVEEVTDIIAAPVERMALDATGNGLTDVVTTFKCQIDECYWNTETEGYPGTVQNTNLLPNIPYINRNLGASLDENGYEAIDVMKSVINGLGVENRWSYRPLGSDTYDEENVPFYDPDHGYVNGDFKEPNDSYFHFGSSMMVVAKHQVSNGLDNGLESQFNNTHYKYRGAIFHNKGRNFQGFRTIIVDNPNGIRSVTDFHQKFPLSGKIESVRTCLKSDGDDDSCGANPLSSTRPISSTDNGYVTVDTATAKTKWVISAKTIEITFELNGREQLSQTTTFVGQNDPGNDLSTLLLSPSSVDALYGNILQTVTKVDSGFGISEKQTTLDFYPADEGLWWINQLKSTTVTTKALELSTANWPVYDAILDSDKTVTTTIDSYDSRGSRQPSSITVSPNDGKVYTKTADYNDYGQPTVVTKTSPGESDREVRKYYSSDSYFVQTETNDIGSVNTYINPIHGQPNRVTGIDLVETQFEYDAYGRSEKTIIDGVPDSFLRYAFCNLCDGLNDANVIYKVTKYAAGTPATTEYRDMLNRIVVSRTQILDNRNAYVNVTYDPLGRKIFESVSSNSPTETMGTKYQFDALNRLTSKLVNKTRTQSRSVSYIYGIPGETYSPHTTQIVVYDGVKTRYLYRTYNGIGQLMQTTDALTNPGITQYAYDGMGNPIVLKDANNESITATYNALDQKKSVTDPNMGKKTFTYTGFGEVDTETDDIGNISDLKYDTLGRVIERDVSGPNENSVSYFKYDKLQGETDKCNGKISREYKDNAAEFDKSYHYNNFCQLVSVKTTIDGDQTFEVQTQVDGRYGRKKAMTYPMSGLTVAYEYSKEGYLKRVYNPENDYTYREITYVDNQGHWTDATIAGGNGSINRGFYPSTGQMESSRFYSSNSVQYLSYEYDADGNLEQQRISDGVNESTENYDYDDMHRLTQTSRIIPGLGTVTTDFNYDAVGNIKKKTDFSAADDNAYTYGTSSRSIINGRAGPNAVRRIVLSNNTTRWYEYDQNGNLLDDGIRQMSYNAFNKPTQIHVNAGIINPRLDLQATASSDSYLYYGSDQMRYKQVKEVNGQTTTHFYIGKLFEQVTKITSTGSLISVEKKSHIDDIAVVTERTDANSNYSSEMIFFHRDRLGSMNAEVDELGVVVRAHSFDAFGRPRNGDLTDKNPFQQLLGLSTNRGFTNHEHLDGPQLIHMNGRVYDYNMGRFMSVDPLLKDPGNSQSMNPYSYLMNNPMAGTDPSGYESETEKRYEFVVTIPQKSGTRIPQTTTTVKISLTKHADGTTTAKFSGLNAAAVAMVKGAFNKAVSETMSQQQIVGVGRYNTRAPIHGNPQPSINTPTHPDTMVRIAIEEANKPGVKSVHMHQRMTTSLGEGSPTKLPDVVVIHKDGRVDMYEIRSKGQTPKSQQDKLKELRIAINRPGKDVVLNPDTLPSTSNRSSSARSGIVTRGPGMVPRAINGIILPIMIVDFIIVDYANQKDFQKQLSELNPVDRCFVTGKDEDCTF